MESGRSKTTRKIVAAKLQALQYEAAHESGESSQAARHHSLEAYAVVSEWEHSVILELLRVHTKASTALQTLNFLARKIGVHPHRVGVLVSRLEKLGLIKWVSFEGSQGSYKVDSEVVLSPDDVPSEALKRFHESMLERARVSLYADPLESRDFYGYTMAMRGSKMPEVKRRIRDFYQTLERDFGVTEADGVGSPEVFHFSNQVMCLTKE